MSAAPRSIAFFDLDHTLVDGDSDTSFIEYLHRRGEVARDVIDDKEPIHAAYLEGRPWQADYERLLARIYGGRDVAATARLAAAHAQEGVLPMLFAGARDLVARERARRSALVLLTTTNQAVAGPVAAALGFDQLLSTRLEVVDGCYTGALVEGFCTGPGKARALLAHCEAAGVDPRRCAMFGDGRSDMEALGAVGEPVAVHPVEALAELAAERGWPTLDLSLPG